MTQAVAGSASLSVIPWGLVVVGIVLLTAGALLWRLRRRRHASEPGELLGLPSLAGGPFALPAVPASEAHATAEPVQTGGAEPPEAPVSSSWPFMPGAATGEHERSEALARLMADALHELGPLPPLSETNHLAEQMAVIIVAEYREHIDLDLNAGVALTACITDQLSYELRQLVSTPS